MKHNIRWTLEKIKKRLDLVAPLVYRRQLNLPPFVYHELASPLVEPPVSPQIDDRNWTTIAPYAYWGKWRTDFVLRTRFRLPEGWDPSLPTALYLPLGSASGFAHPEALVYIDGEPYASCDRAHHEILIPPEYLEGEEHLLALHGWTGLGGRREQENHLQFNMQPSSIVQIDPALRSFIATARVAVGTAGQIGRENPARSLLLSGLDQAFRILDTRAPLDGRFYESVSAAHAELLDAVENSGPSLNVDVQAVGHAHLDVAWLWTLGQTRRKAGRTFHNVIRLMERFPEFKFTQSQPQLYEFICQDYPKLFETITQRVKEGRWEPIGGMWVEADCNLTGAESLARQFLLGRSFYRQHFGEGADAPVLWLPDVFGYAWNLPQLIQQAGLKYFFTIKIGWNQYNRMPYDSFWWQGLDGTRILTHYSTTTDSENGYASTYNSGATPEEVYRTWSNFQQKDWGNQGSYPPLLMSFGWGDGGGGPTTEMLENIREMGDFPALPHTHCGTAEKFFENLEENFGESLPVWNGELYLEYHRGTYTTQARNKRANRKSEVLLHNAEFLASLARSYDLHFRYPQTDLNRAWQLVCLNQFHDIIPGSSIREVYVESLEHYQEVREIGEKVIGHAFETLRRAHPGCVHVINTAPVTRDDPAFTDRTDLPPLIKPNGTHAATQPVEGGTLIDLGSLAPYSVTALWAAGSPAPERENRLSVSERHLENDRLRVEFNARGDITRILDKKSGRELLPQDSIANQFQAFEDRPMNWDAWDIEIYYDDRIWYAEPAQSIKVTERGPLRAAIEIRRRILESEIVQRISLTARSSRLDFNTWIDWQQQHMLLKTAFPVDVLAPTASYEIQWGQVQRPTHTNTSWDWARFETCAHKWADVSENGFGVSLLNDCKYGYDIKDGKKGSHAVMRLSLLRSPTYPDPEADQGEHRFTYSIYPHAGTLGMETISEGYALNYPLIVDAVCEGREEEPAAPVREEAPFLSCDQSNILIETVKRAEDGNGWIIRLYESLGQRTSAQIKPAFPLSAAWATNLIEDNQDKVAVIDGQVSLTLRPFQIQTLRLFSDPA